MHDVVSAGPDRARQPQETRDCFAAACFQVAGAGKWKLAAKEVSWRLSLPHGSGRIQRNDLDLVSLPPPYAVETGDEFRARHRRGGDYLKDSPPTGHPQLPTWVPTANPPVKNRWSRKRGYRL